MLLPKATELFDLDHTLAKEVLINAAEIYSVIPKIGALCKRLSRSLGSDYVEIFEDVFAARDAKISEFASICGPAIIGHETEIRPGAYIRGSVIIGDGAVIGNSTELKNSIIFDAAELPHYNYVGDSIIGYHGHLGAGVIVSNFRLDRKSVRIKRNNEKFDTGLRKMGVLLGDCTEVGSNSVIYPGTIIGKMCIVYPLSRVYGIIPEKHYYYNENNMAERK